MRISAFSPEDYERGAEMLAAFRDLAHADDELAALTQLSDPVLQPFMGGADGTPLPLGHTTPTEGGPSDNLGIGATCHDIINDRPLAASAVLADLLHAYSGRWAALTPIAHGGMHVSRSEHFNGGVVALGARHETKPIIGTILATPDVSRLELVVPPRWPLSVFMPSLEHANVLVVGETDRQQYAPLVKLAIAGRI